MSSPTRRISKEMETEIRAMQKDLQRWGRPDASFVEASKELAMLNKKTKVRVIL